MAKALFQTTTLGTVHTFRIYPERGNERVLTGRPTFGVTLNRPYRITPNGPTWSLDTHVAGVWEPATPDTYVTPEEAAADLVQIMSTSITNGHAHESVTTANGHGSYCRACGVTLS